MLPIPISVLHVFGPKTGPGAPPLELVIPFTTLSNVQRTISMAEQLSCGLNASVRVIRVVPVPYPLDLDYPAVATTVVESQMTALHSSLPLTVDIRLSRDRNTTLFETVSKDSLVLMSYEPRFWKTEEEKLARALTRAGRQVTLMPQSENNHA